MTKHLIIAEKPNMGLEIANAFIKSNLAHSDINQAKLVRGDGFVTVGDITVSWAFGHLMESYSPQDYNPAWEKWQIEPLPLIMDTWKVKVTPDKMKQFNVIKKLVSAHDIIYNAGDPGREGQLIVDEILEALANKKPVKRLNLVSLKKTAVLNEFQNCADNSKYYNLYQAAIGRGIADWLVGFNASRLYTIKAQKKGYKGVLSVGRVQSPLLAIVVKRDLEIDNFVPHKYYTIQATFSANGNSFNTTWKPSDKTNPSALDAEKRLIDKSVFDNIVAKIQGKQGKVLELTETSGKEYAPLPFNLSKLQIYANAKWGMSAQDVLDTCQALYEKHKVQTYPRTDCQYLPTDQFSSAPELLNKVAIYIPQLANAANSANPTLKSAAWDDSKLTDHFGLIPTGTTVDWNSLNKKEQNIHQAVCERYIAQFHPACEFNASSLTIECEQEIFKATGKVIVKPGWKSIFKDIEEIPENDKKGQDEENQIFPKLNKDEIVNHDKTKSETKDTKAPPRYTEGSLLNAATNIHTLVSDPKKKQILKDKKGIGQEATRALIIENFIKRNLLVRQGKNLISTSGARTLIAALPFKIIDPSLTAVWEDYLDRIAAGKITLEAFKQLQITWVKDLIAEGKSQDIELVVAPSTQKTKACPSCGKGHLVEKTAKASGKKFTGCSTWPTCNYVEWPKTGTSGKSGSSTKSSGYSKTTNSSNTKSSK